MVFCRILWYNSEVVKKGDYMLKLHNFYNFELLKIYFKNIRYERNAKKWKINIT